MISINKKIFFLIISLIFLSGGFAYAAITNNLKIPFIKNSQTKYCFKKRRRLSR